MQFFKFQNMTIRGKLVTILLFVIVLELISSIFSTFYLNAVHEQLESIVDRESEKIKLTGKIHEEFLEIHRAQKNLLMTTTGAQVDRYAAQSLGNQNDIQDNLLKLERLAYEDERALIREFRVPYAEFISIDSRITSIVRRDWTDPDTQKPAHINWAVNREAVELSWGSARNAFDRASEVLGNIVRKMDASLQEGKEKAGRHFQRALMAVIGICALSIFGGLFAGLMLSRSITANIRSIVNATDSIARGKLDTVVHVTSKDEVGSLAESVRDMQKGLLRARNDAAERDWLNTGIGRMNDVMRGKLDLNDLCTGVISEAAVYLDAQVGTLFLPDGGEAGPRLIFSGGYAYSNRNGFPDRFNLGEGLVGQAALEKKQIVLREVPRDYLKVVSGLGDSRPRSITVTPLVFGDQIKGIAELGFLGDPTDIQLEYLRQAAPVIAANIETVRGRDDLARALSKAQMLAEELQRQQEALKAANEELEEQTQLLTQSQEKLRNQQEELEQTNQELEEKNEYLNRQKEEMERANRDLERTRLDIEEKAEQLAAASKYKSEFLANMSHELRTPLNSMLLLSRLLTENREGNLNEDQIRSAEIVYKCGDDLLSLINEILDLSRIEAGRMEIRVQEIALREVGGTIVDSLRSMAQEKGLEMEISMEEGCPDRIWTDRSRLEQILKNLVSNAIKFTEKGKVGLRFGLPESSASTGGSDRMVSIAVEDTGIGIPSDKQNVIFEAFQQLEGGASRRYGGTGLGLSISRELARLLGGEIRVRSEEGKGSIFILDIPVKKPIRVQTESLPAPKRREKEAELAPRSAAPRNALTIQDDRSHLGAEDQRILIIEDDQSFAEVLLGQCRQKGFKCLAAGTGEEGLTLAHEYLPNGILLDIRLPGKDGWAVLEELKESPKTRHIPIHIISVEDASIEALRKGAVGFLTKPACQEDLEEAIARLENMFRRQIKDLLLVEDEANLRGAIVRLIGNGDVRIDEAENAAKAMQAMRSKRYDCMVLDLGLPDMNGLEMLRALDCEEGICVPPVIVYTGREITCEEEAELKTYSDSIIVKGVRSEERLLDEVSLFLHRMVSKMPESKRKMITNLHDKDRMFHGKKVLIVDDDMRNAFALSRVLEKNGVRTIKAENGKKALDILQQQPDFDLILMDIMMPDLDGYETMKRIRAQEKFRKTAIIALTAKAMKQDRERCLAAGASDYLPKPVNIDRLFSMMRVWLYR